ncbi:MAG: glutathione S-transferase N-terminal domain-containing protein [Pseudolabrys sp.]
MKLIGSETSPYVRKVRVYLAETKIPCDFEVVGRLEAGATALRTRAGRQSTGPRA